MCEHVIHGNQWTNTSLRPCELGKKKSQSQNRSALHFHLHTTLHHFKAFNETPQNILTRHHGKPPSSCDITVVQQHHHKNTLKRVLSSKRVICHLSFNSSFRIIFTINCLLSSDDQYNATQSKPKRLNNNFNTTAVHTWTHTWTLHVE